MALIDCASSLQVCAMRVAQLGPDGVPLPGAGNVYVTDAMVKLTATPELEAGEEFSLKNGCGVACIDFKDCDRIKRLTMALEICSPDPELTELLVGGTLITSGGTTIGYAYPRVGAAACYNGVSIEAWTKAVVTSAQATVRPWWRWVFPRTYWQVGEKSLENGILSNPLTGFGIENPNFYNGPANDVLGSTASVMSYYRDTAIPATTCGTSTLVAS